MAHIRTTQAGFPAGASCTGVHARLGGVGTIRGTLPSGPSPPRALLFFPLFSLFFLFLCLSVSTMHVHPRRPRCFPPHPRGPRTTAPPFPYVHASASTARPPGGCRTPHPPPHRPGPTPQPPAARGVGVTPPGPAAPHPHRRSPRRARVRGGPRRGVGATPPGGGPSTRLSGPSRSLPPASPRRCRCTPRTRRPGGGNRRGSASFASDP